MASYFILVLDTLAPANITLLIDGGSTYTSKTNRLADLTISTADTSTAGYQMKIWGDVDLTHNANIQNTEANSNWTSYTAEKQIKLSENDGRKTINIKLRDDVYNESSVVSASISLDTTLPTVVISGVDTNKISKKVGKNIMSFSFTATDMSGVSFAEYKVMVVSGEGSAHDTGVVIPTTNGSTNMSGVGTFSTNTPINCTINGSDLETASSGDGEKCIKVFVKDLAGNWSV